MQASLWLNAVARQQKLLILALPNIFAYLDKLPVICSLVEMSRQAQFFLWLSIQVAIVITSGQHYQLLHLVLFPKRRPLFDLSNPGCNHQKFNMVNAAQQSKVCAHSHWQQLLTYLRVGKCFPSAASPSRNDCREQVTAWGCESSYRLKKCFGH